MKCDNEIAMEEITLKFLKDNIGRDGAFSPVCVFIREASKERNIVKNKSERVVKTTALQMDVTFVVRHTFLGWVRKREVSNLGDKNAQKQITSSVAQVMPLTKAESQGHAWKNNAPKSAFPEKIIDMMNSSRKTSINLSLR